MIASSAWGGSEHVRHNYASLLWSRIFQGVALAPFEALVNACVGDLYYVHERGVRMALTNTCLFGGAFLTPVFVGMISAHLGWQWSVSISPLSFSKPAKHRAHTARSIKVFATVGELSLTEIHQFFLLAIFMSLGFLLLVFFVPETAYRRAHSLDLDLLAEGDSSSETADKGQTVTARDGEEKPLNQTRQTEAIPAKDSYLKRLMPFNGRKTDESFFKLLFRPFPLFLHPAVLWACLMQGVIIGWTVMVGVILSLIFLGPPLFFNEEKAGKMYTSAFIGSILGLFGAGIYSEVVTRYLTRLNKGKYEPEFRILLVIPTLVFSCIGLYGFGITAKDVARYGWIVPEVFLAFIIISMVMGSIASAQYLLDAHRDIAVEAFTNLIIFKNIFSFILAYNAFDWVFSIRINRLFIIFGSIELVICLLSVPMYVLGKKNRDFFHRHDLLRLTKLR